MFNIDFANIMCVVAVIFGFIIIQLIAEFDMFQDYLTHKYDIYSKNTEHLHPIDTQKWLDKMEIIEARLSLLQISNEDIFLALEKMRLCREYTE